jgi:hypothetical protein
LWACTLCCRAAFLICGGGARGPMSLPHPTCLLIFPLRACSRRL